MQKVCAQLKTFGSASTRCFYTGQFTFPIMVFLFHALLSHGFLRGKHDLCGNSSFGLKNWRGMAVFLLSESSNFLPSCVHRCPFHLFSFDYLCARL